MHSNVQNVPYGYEPPVLKEKGSLIYYDSFEHTCDEELDQVVKLAVDRSFARLVFYPIHEETWRRMSKKPITAYHKREKKLNEWMQQNNRDRPITIDGWEGKRKKYTPMDSALRHLTETLAAPHFLFLTPEMANLFAAFNSFEEWIVKVRLLLSAEPEMLHPRLEKYGGRWNSVNNLE